MRSVNGISELRTLVGQEIATSDWLAVTQDQIDRFAELTGDNQWIHVDTERARKESPFGAPIAHGFLTMSLLGALRNQAVEVRGNFKMRVNYGFNRLRFSAPVPAGSRIRARFTANSIKEFDGGAEIAWGVVLEVEGATKPALVAEWLGRLYY